MPSVEGNGAAVDFRGAVTKSEGVVWGQVVVAFRDDDPIRRRRADTDEKASLFSSFDAGGPAARSQASEPNSRRDAREAHKALHRQRCGPIGDRRMGGAESSAFRRTTAKAEGGVTRLAIRPTAIRPPHRQDGRDAIGRRLGRQAMRRRTLRPGA